MSDRLDRMRNWISGPHFPEELRIRIRDEPMQGLDSDIIAASKFHFQTVNGGQMILETQYHHASRIMRSALVKAIETCT